MAISIKFQGMNILKPGSSYLIRPTTIIETETLFQGNQLLAIHQIYVASFQFGLTKGYPVGFPRFIESSQRFTLYLRE